MSYKLLKTFRHEDLETQAAELMAEGWKLGPFSYDHSHGVYCQVLTKKARVEKQQASAEYPTAFEALWKMYPKRAGSNPKKKAHEAWRARIKECTGPEAKQSEIKTMTEGLVAYFSFCQLTGKLGTETVMQAARFFGPGREYTSDWAPPEPEKDGVTQLPAKNDDLLGWAQQRGYPGPAAGMSWGEYRSFLMTQVEDDEEPGSGTHQETEGTG